MSAKTDQEVMVKLSLFLESDQEVLNECIFMW